MTDRRVLYLIGGLTLLQLAIALLTYGQTLYFDEASWHYVGRNWFRLGIVPYKGGYDNKFPLIFAIYGVSDLLFGVNYWCPRVIGTLVQSVGIWFLYRTVFPIGGRRAGVFVVLLYGLSALWTSTQGKYVSLTETYEVTALIVAFYFFVRARGDRDLFISGLFVALALAFRLTAVAGGLSIFVFSFLKRRSYAVWFAMGGATGVLSLIGLAWLAGLDLSETWHHSMIDNVSAGNMFVRSFGEKLHGAINGFIFSPLALFYPFVIGYWVVRRRLDWITLWLLGGCICIYRIGLFDPAHFKDILAPLSLAGGLFIDDVMARYTLPFAPVLVVLAICFFPNVAEPMAVIGQMVHPPADTSDGYCRPPYSPLDLLSKKKLGWWIRDHSSKEEKVLVPCFGATIQAYSERLAPTVYFNTNEMPKAKEQFYREVREHKPDIVIMPMSDYYRKLLSPERLSFLRQLVDTGDYRNDTCVYGYSIYRIVKKH